jgi:hypothetical protein
MTKYVDDDRLHVQLCNFLASRYNDRRYNIAADARELVEFLRSNGFHIIDRHLELAARILAWEAED